MKLDELYNKLNDIDLTAEYMAEFTETMQAVTFEGDGEKLGLRLPSMLYCLEKLNEELERKREDTWQWYFGEKEESDKAKQKGGIGRIVKAMRDCLIDLGQTQRLAEIMKNRFDKEGKDDVPDFDVFYRELGTLAAQVYFDLQCKIRIMELNVADLSYFAQKESEAETA